MAEETLQEIPRKLTDKAKRDMEERQQILGDPVRKAEFEAQLTQLLRELSK